MKKKTQRFFGNRIGWVLFLVLSGLACSSSVASAASAQKGQASFYYGYWHGRKTANGETYDQHSMTAAHRTLPFGTKVEVKNLRNGRSVIVRINNRGPFTKGRIIDLSLAAAQKLGMTKSGVAPVEVKILDRA